MSLWNFWKTKKQTFLWKTKQTLGCNYKLRNNYPWKDPKWSRWNSDCPCGICVEQEKKTCLWKTKQTLIKHKEQIGKDPNWAAWNKREKGDVDILQHKEQTGKDPNWSAWNKKRKNQQGHLYSSRRGWTVDLEFTPSCSTQLSYRGSAGHLMHFCHVSSLS